jgi:integrase
VLTRLKGLKQNLGDIVPAEYFVFGTQDGKHLGYKGLHNVLEDLISEALEADILPDDERWISGHAARHRLNTSLLAAGVAPLLVQSFLG